MESIELELPDDQMLALTLEAHRQGITLNQLVSKVVLLKSLDAVKEENETLRAENEKLRDDAATEGFTLVQDIDGYYLAYSPESDCTLTYETPEEVEGDSILLYMRVM